MCYILDIVSHKVQLINHLAKVFVRIYKDIIVDPGTYGNIPIHKYVKKVCPDYGNHVYYTCNPVLVYWTIHAALGGYVKVMLISIDWPHICPAAFISSQHA